MAAGQLGGPAEHASVVIPGAKWEIVPDIANRSVALKLTPTPEWASHSPVAPPEFFLLPFDGSKSWKFDDAARGNPTAAQKALNARGNP